MAQHSTTRRAADRYSRIQPVPPRRRPRRFGWLRRLVGAALILALAALAAWLYLDAVYAPGLRAEARTVPALVRQDLAQHGETYLPLQDISPYLQRAIVAIEDRRFYYHPGVDPVGMLRAAWVDLTRQHIDQGGSTLEQQLVKRAIVHDDSSFRAKLRTVALAWAVDQELTKSEVLELYLNAAYYGQGAYGAGAAAHVYFGTDAAHLTLPQAAFLAALPQAPSVYGAHPLAAVVIDRQRTVLADMLRSGYITPKQEKAAAGTRLTFALPNP